MWSLTCWTHFSVVHRPHDTLWQQMNGKFQFHFLLRGKGIFLFRSLVSTHIVCERLSAMQGQATLPEFLVHFRQNTLFCPGKTTPPPPIGTSHGGLGKFICAETSHCIPHGYHFVGLVLSQIFLGEWLSDNWPRKNLTLFQFEHDVDFFPFNLATNFQTIVP